MLAGPIMPKVRHPAGLFVKDGALFKVNRNECSI